MNMSVKLKTKIIGLDMLRGCAALGVMVYHYFFIGVIEGFYSWDVFLESGFWGQFGVDIFFLLSGFVILLSTQNRNWKSFLYGRIKRIYPTFLLCSIIVLVVGFTMPNTENLDLIKRWICSVLFCYNIPGGGDPLSSVYWTLAVEVRFYILVAIIMKTKMWHSKKYELLIYWLVISLLNNYFVQNEFVYALLLTKYSGHFCFGILCYLLYKKQYDKKMTIIGIISIWLIYLNCIGYTSWIRGIWPDLPYSDVEILFAVLSMVILFYMAVFIGKENIVVRVISAFAPISYAFYLIHADWGYFIRTQYYYRVLPTHTFLLNYVNEYTLMAVGISTSIVISYLVYKLIKRV